LDKLLIIMAFFTFLGSTTGHSEVIASFPSGWRLADRADYSTEDLSFLNNRVPNRVESDFNGDGINDDARILLNDIEKKFGLFVFLGKKEGGYKTIKLVEYLKDTVKLYMGIFVITHGKHITACGKGYGNCAPDEPKELTLRNPGINFFQFESASSVFYWDPEKNEFKRVWLSD